MDVEAVVDLLSGSEVSLVLKLVLGLGLLLFYIWWKRNEKRIKIEQAKKETDQQIQTDRTQTTTENTQTGTQASGDETSIEDWRRNMRRENGNDGQGNAT
jgi:uncharacterized protein HemX